MLQVDTLFLDNTYLSKEFEFPSQDEAFEQLVASIKALEDFRSYTVLVGVDTLGKEELLVRLAQYFGSRVEVSSPRYAALEAIYNLGAFSQSEFEVGA